MSRSSPSRLTRRLPPKVKARILYEMRLAAGMRPCPTCGRVHDERAQQPTCAMAHPLSKIRL